MAQTDILRKLAEAGLAFTEMTRARAEAVVKELVRSGEVQRDQAQHRVDELLDLGRKGSEQLLGVVRKEIAAQLRNMGLATTEDLERTEARLDARITADCRPARPSPPPPGPKGGPKGGPQPPEGGTSPPPAKKQPARPPGWMTPTPPPGSATRATRAVKVAKAAETPAAPPQKKAGPAPRPAAPRSRAARPSLPGAGESPT